VHPKKTPITEEKKYPETKPTYNEHAIETSTKIGSPTARPKTAYNGTLHKMPIKNMEIKIAQLIISSLRRSTSAIGVETQIFTRFFSRILNHRFQIELIN